MLGVGGTSAVALTQPSRPRSAGNAVGGVDPCCMGCTGLSCGIVRLGLEVKHRLLCNVEDGCDAQRREHLIVTCIVLIAEEEAWKDLNRAM